MKYALDTNIISAIMSKNIMLKGKVDTELMTGTEFFMPGICYYEIKRGFLEAGNKRKLDELNVLMCKLLKILFLDDVKIFDIASEIWANSGRGRKPFDADVLIAATVITQKNMTLVSENTRHFEWINGLSVENWLKK